MFQSRWALVGIVAVALGAASLCLGQDAQPAASKFEVRKATYEAAEGRGGADVTEKVKALVQNGKLVMDVTNAVLGGDPTPGRAKRLNLEYIVDGKPQTITVREGEHLELPPLSPAEQKARLLPLLKSDAPQQEKADACRQLAIVGGKDAIPVLAGLLSHEKLSHMARYALEPMTDPEVDDAFRAALGQVKGVLLVGVINSIGVRRDVKAIEPLTKLLQDPDTGVAAAAAISLGKIGTTDSAKTLDQAQAGAPEAVRPAIQEGRLFCAEALAAQGKRDEAIAIYDALRAAQAPIPIRIAALRGAILTRQAEGLTLLLEQIRGADPHCFALALRVAMELPGPEVSKALADEVAKLPADKQPSLIQVLGKRADAAALPVLLATAKSGEKAIRIAALQALPEIGDVSAVPTLVEATADVDDDVSRTAKESLAGIQGKEVDAAVIALLDKTEPKDRLTAIELIGRRRMTAEIPRLFKAADDADQAVRLAALKTLGQLGGETEAPALLDRLLNAKESQDRDACERALSAAAAKTENADACAEKIIARLASAQPEQKNALLRVLSAVGGPKALQAVRAAVGDPNADVHATAIRTLGKWKTADAAEGLLELAKTSTDATDKLLCLRSYIGLASNRDLTDEQRVGICKQAAALIQRDDEKKLLLGVLSGIASAESLAEVAPYMDNAATKEEACVAAFSIADRLMHGKNPGKHAAGVVAPLQKVAQTTANADLAKRADTLAKEAQGKAPRK